MKPNRLLPRLTALIFVLLAQSSFAASLTDYGSLPPIAQPHEDLSAANEKLDFHTDPFTGRFSYSIPIRVPPARGGSEPGIALQYNSANKNGWCGVGWELDMGYIERDNRHGVLATFSGGGRTGTIAYTNSMGFIFSIAGKAGRLISITTNDYRPQIDADFLRFSFTNGWWVVTDRGGRKYNFGETSASQITNSYGTFRWALSSIRDPNGNRTYLSYTSQGGQLYLKEIDYNGNDNSPNIATNCAVVFDLTNRADSVSSLASGSEIITSNLLGSIRVYSQGQLARRYQLQYTNSSSTGRSLIQKVTEFGSDNSSSLPAQTFSYSVQTPSFQPTNAWAIVADTNASAQGTYQIAPTNPNQQLVDINGDGLPDWVFLGPYPHNTFSVQLNTGSGFGPLTSWSGLANELNSTAESWCGPDGSQTDSGTLNSYSTSQLIDMNGDMLPDRVMRGYYGTTYFQVQLNDTNSASFDSLSYQNGVSGAGSGSTYTDTQSSSTTSSDGEGSLAAMVDMNGDGLPDHVIFGSQSGQLAVQLNLGSSFDTAIAWQNSADAGGSYGNSPRERSVDIASQSYMYAELMDMNGDGLPDRVLTNGLQLNNGVNGFNPLDTTWGFGSSNPQVVYVDPSNNYGDYTSQLIDMNGDGLPDRVVSNGNGTYSVYFNTGRGFSSTAVTWSGVDISGNLVTGGGWNHLQAWDGNGTMVLFIDMNGDGLVDRVERNYNVGNYLLVQLSTGPYPDLMITASNGIGASVNISYLPSTQYNNSDGVRSRLPFPVYTVSSVTEHDGHGDSGTSGYVTSYGYVGGLYDTTYREFRGFSSVTQTNPSGSYLITWFHQGGGTNAAALGEYNDDLAKAGMPYRVENYGTNNKLYSRSIIKVDEVRVHSNGVFFPFVGQSIKQDYEGNTGYRATAVESTYNAISNNLAGSTGNLIGQTNYGEVINVNISAHTFTAGNTVPPVYRQYSYATIGSNPDIVDHVAVETLSTDAAGATVLRQTSNTYYMVTGDLQTKNDLVCPSAWATTSYTYESYGNVQTITDPVGVVKTINYDSVTGTYPVKKYTGSLSYNLIEYSQYDTRSGAIVAATNLQGMVTANSYDVFFRPLNSAISTSQNVAATLTRVKYEYSLGGVVNANCSNYVHVSRNDPSDTSTGFHESYTYFDGLGRPIQTREESETGGQYRVSNLAYDVCGELTLQEYPFFSSGALYTKNTGSRTNVFTEYDAVDRAFRVDPVATATFTSSGWWNGSNPSVSNGDSGSPVGASSIAFKDGTNPWAIIVTNALGKIHKFYLDAYGRTNQIVEVTGQGNFTSSLAYDQVGDLTNITDNAQNQISFFYDLMGRKVAMADPDMGFWQFGLDAAGRLKVQTDAKGQKLKFFYNDPAGRLTQRQGWNATNGLVSTVTYQYDSSGGDGNYTVYPGQLFSMTDDEGWQKLSYDVRNRTVKTVRYLSKNGQTYTNQFTLDDADRTSSVSYPNSGPTVTNIFDTGENLSKVQRVDAGGTNIIFYTAQSFDELDRLTGINFGNGAATTFGYYKVSKRLNQIITTISGSTQIQNFTNRYDAVGNIIALQDNVSSHTNGAAATISSATYDDLNRLTAATWTTYGQKSYAYDSVGNVLTNGEFGTTNYTYGTIRPHCVRTANGNWYTYDQNGNIVFRTGQRLEYDVNNRLSRVTSTNGVVTTFGYDGDGARLWELGGTNSLQVWIGDIYEERDGKVLYHIDAGGRRVCSFEPVAGGVTGYNASTQEFYFYHPDYLTSASLLTERGGTQVQHYEYSAFGQSRYTQSLTAFHVSRRYTGQVLDEDTGLYYYNFRYYDPQVGRFIQPDDVIPDLLNPQSYNRYAYCVNNPLRYADPSGHDNIYAAGQGGSSLIFNNAPVALHLEIAPEIKQVLHPSIPVLQAAGTFAQPTPEYTESVATGRSTTRSYFEPDPVMAGVGMGITKLGPQIALAAATEGAGTVLRLARAATVLEGVGAAEGTAPTLGSLTPSQVRTIQAFSDRFGAEVNVVGSRAAGTAGPFSDFDYVVGGNAKLRNAAEYYLPRNPQSVMGNEPGNLPFRGIDIFNANKTPLDPTRPFIQFTPGQPPVVGPR